MVSKKSFLSLTLLDTASLSSLYSIGYKYFIAKSSSSHLKKEIPSLPAKGAYISIVSLDILCCLSGGTKSKERILWSLSANFIIITLKSFAIAMNNFLKFSAWASSLFVPKSRWSNLVTPSTSSNTTSPNSAWISKGVTGVSSKTSCKNAAWMVTASIPKSASMSATAQGCVM